MPTNRFIFFQFVAEISLVVLQCQKVGALGDYMGTQPSPYINGETEAQKEAPTLGQRASRTFLCED